MQRALINLLPSWVCIGLSVLVFTAISALIFHLVEKYFSHLRHKDNGPLLPSVIAVTSANYSFLLGFAVIVLWQAFNRAELIASSEANRLGLIMRDSAALPEPMKGEIVKAVGDYVRIVIEDEWPAMRTGAPIAQDLKPIQLLFHAVQRHPPVTESEKMFYREVVTNINYVVEKRVERLDSTDSILTGPLRFLLIAGIFVITFLMSMVYTENRKVHFIAVMSVAAIISFNVGVALTLDYPFSGDVSVSFEPFQEGILAQVNSDDWDKKNNIKSP